MSHSGNHPPLEELAAYIDGLLGEEEAARVAEHISECEDCFFVYSETVRFQLEHPFEEEDPVPNVVPFPRKTKEVPGPGRRAVAGKRKRAFPRWLGIAAAAAVVAAVGIPLYRSLNPPSMPEMTTAELLAPVQGASDLQGQLYDFKRPRGGGESSDYERQSFMIGVFLTDLRLALENGDTTEASDRLQRIHSILHEFGGMDEEVDQLRQEEAQMKTSADLKTFLPKLQQWEENAGQSEDAIWVVNPDYVTFGKWAEAGRVAAVLRRREFFNKENRSVLSCALQCKEVAPDDAVKAHLQEIERIWDKGDLQSQDFDALADKFKTILESYDTLR